MYTYTLIKNWRKKRIKSEVLRILYSTYPNAKKIISHEFVIDVTKATLAVVVHSCSGYFFPLFLLCKLLTKCHRVDYHIRNHFFSLVMRVLFLHQMIDEMTGKC
jgi:hypothetical protein